MSDTNLRRWRSVQPKDIQIGMVLMDGQVVADVQEVHLGEQDCVLIVSIDTWSGLQLSALYRTTEPIFVEELT